MAAEVVVRLLGEPSVTVDGRAVESLAAPRQLSLLALLVVNRRTLVTRQRAAFALWPDSSEPQARTNLRRALHFVRRELPDAERHVDLDGPLLGWRLDSPARVDLVELDDAARAVADGDPLALERAVGAYAGDLLPGATDDWLEPVRSRLHQEHVERLERLTERCAAAGDRAASIHWCEELLLVDPLHEPTYRRLIGSYGSADRARAVRTFHRCAATLERELGVTPSEETSAAYEGIVAPRAPVAGDAGSARRLVGRDAERAELAQAVRRAAAGNCAVVLVHGEPGIGKSHLLADVVAWCERESLVTVATRAYEAEGRLALAPIADVLRSPAVRASLTQLGEPWRDDIARIVPDIVTTVVRPETATLDGTERTRLFTAVSRAVRAVGQPLVVAIDDLQWCDVDTLELLHFLVRTSADVPLVVLSTARDEGLFDGPLATVVAGLRSLSALVDIPLDRLGPDDAEEIVTATLGHRPPEDVLRRVVETAGGNPLFLVELARQDADPVTGELHLPAHVQAVIARRLDALSPQARGVADVMAVIGRHADVDLIERLWPTSEGDPADGLDELWRRRILVEVGTNGYDFGHDRIRDVAYAALGPARRRALHRQVADALRTRWADALDGVAATIAGHLERAGCVDEAIDQYERAIDAASRVFAYDEVIMLARRALGLLARTPADLARASRERSLLGPLAVASYSGPGFGPETRDVMDRIAELRADGGPPLDPNVLRLAANAAVLDRRFDTTYGIGAELLARGEHTGDRLLITEGNYLLGVGSFWLGRLPDSARHLERAIAAYNEQRRDLHIQRFGQDPRAVCLVRLGLTAWHRGDVAEATRLRRLAREEAAATGHEYTIGYIAAFALWGAYDAGEYDEVEEILATRPASSNRFMVLHCGAFAAAVTDRHGPRQASIDRLADIVDRSAVEQPMVEPIALVLLAEVLGRAGQGHRGLEAVRKARGIAATEMPIMLTSAWLAEASLLRQVGAPSADVRRALDATVDVARHQGAVIFERRAAEARAAWGLN